MEPYPMPNTDNVSQIDLMPDYDKSMLIALGDEAEKFKSSRLGKYLLGKALAEATNAIRQMRELKSTDDKFREKFDEYQSIIKRHEEFEDWLNEAVNVGRQAYEQYEQDLSEG